MGDASKILSRFTPSLLERLENLAQVERTSVDDLLLIAVAEKIARAEHSAWLAHHRAGTGEVIATCRGRLGTSGLVQEEVERKSLTDVFEEAPVFLAVLSGPEHIFAAVNQSYQALVGRRELIGKRIIDGLPELAGTVWIDRLNGVYSTGEPLVQRGAHVALATVEGKPLENKYVDYAYKARRAPDGSISGITVLGVDASLVQRVLRSTQVPPSH